MATSLPDMPPEILHTIATFVLLGRSEEDDATGVPPSMPAFLQTCRYFRNAYTAMYIANTHLTLWRLSPRNARNIGSKSVNEKRRFLSWIKSLGSRNLLHLLHKVSIHEVRMSERHNWGGWPLYGIATLDFDAPRSEGFRLTLKENKEGLDHEVEAWYIDPEDENYIDHDWEHEWLLDDESRVPLQSALENLRTRIVQEGCAKYEDWREIVDAIWTAPSTADMNRNCAQLSSSLTAQ